MPSDRIRSHCPPQGNGPIIQTEEPLANFNPGYLLAIPQDHGADDLTTLDESTGNTPPWILGHLPIASESASQLLWAEPGCGPDWFAACGSRSQPRADNAPPSTMSEILSAIETGYPGLPELVAAAPKQTPSEQYEFQRFEPALMSKRDLMSHLLTTHFTYELARLSACRRGKGRAALL